jgi:RNA polymerase sigma-70 factor (ECF subfamily)
VISRPDLRDDTLVMAAPAPRTPPEATEAPAAEVAPLSAAQAQRLTAMVDAHWQATGRVLRHLGVRSDLDDALQQVFLTALRKLEFIRPGSERAFLASVAVHVAARHRRRLGQAREQPTEQLEAEDSSAGPESRTERARLLQRFDDVLSGLDDPLRTVLVLHEIEELSMAEIATMLAIPPGTVASRLRRAREAFRERMSP